MHGEDCATRSEDLAAHTAPAARTQLDNVKVHPASLPTAPKRTDEPSIHDVIDLDAGATADVETCFSFCEQKLVEPIGIEPTT